jgi:hypothetical protein
VRAHWVLDLEKSSPDVLPTPGRGNTLVHPLILCSDVCNQIKEWRLEGKNEEDGEKSPITFFLGSHKFISWFI